MMNPMDFFNQKNGFPFNMMPQQQFNPEQLHSIKQMVKQYNTIINDEFWGDVHGLAAAKNTRETPNVPIEIWENDKYLFVTVIIPNLTDLKHVKIFFKNNQRFTLKIKMPSYKPEGAVTLLASNCPQRVFEKEVSLKKPVNTSDYSYSYEGGILLYTFQKAANETLDIPFDF
ncbi:hypothetical protein EJF36_11960 [Bacillus sp. HMF5848]|uniref:Hsp20/alpha crystallin family protein n=1 Tax=Bacillus sp. HMF5848 TaxID=2495421 RepID=UPI000F785880|nr:Hsp20/alpha crystallin family protein [Bacillus sp. HMF5848]RSK27534.1 hypothetical protein EJF36_11960 [Bacillus sp. HMF5848]